MWAFLGDGETDEPETWARSSSPRAKISTNILVVNCDLQRLDGPVRETGGSRRNSNGLPRRGLERD